MEQYSLSERIKSGLIFLVLGQNYFNKKSPLVEMIRKEYQLEPTSKTHDVYLGIQNVEVIPWIRNQADNLLEPDSLKIISRLPWNGVITSEVDGIVERVFRNSWREIYAIYNADNKIIGSLSDRNRLAISCLFGTINNELEGSHLPLTQLEFYKAKSNAIRMISKYTQDVITPFGTIIIDGYNPEDDWLELEMLFPLVAACREGQVHYFGQSISSRNDLWKSLVEKKIIIEYEQTFAEYLAVEEDNRNLDIDELVYERENTRRISVHNKSFSIPKNIYNTTSKNALILDDSIFVLDELEDDEKEDKFRYFLYESGNKPVWEGYKWGFYFRRDIEEKIDKKIRKEISKDFNTNPIIIEGQSGAGKSVLLGNVAYKLKLQRQFPIIFIPQFMRGISYTVILEFCEWLEKNCKAERVIIIWDASVYNEEIAQYIELNNFLMSAGRKVLIIGSSLKLSENIKSAYTYESIEMDIQISDAESESICNVFNKYSGSVITDTEIRAIGEKNIFVACYRLLPPSRRSLRRGVIDEAKKNKVTLKEALKIKQIDETSVFCQALMKAGVFVPNEANEEKVALDMLLDYICVPAQFGLMIPLNLVLRCFDSQYSVDIAKKIDELDFFRFIEGVNGEWEVSSRNSLEAEIVINSELSNLQKQMDIIKKIILEIRDADGYVSNYNELNFLVDLLKAIGPNGKKNKEYLPYYNQITEALKTLRENGIWDSRTILQESLFLREYAKNLNVKTQKYEMIVQAQELIRSEINRLVEKKQDNFPHMGRLYCEWASNLGAQIVEKLGCEVINENEISNLYKELIEKIQYARDYLPDSFYALDICGWASLEVLQNRKLSNKLKEEIYVEAVSIFEQAEITYPSFCMLPEYNVRLMQLNDAYGEDKVAKISFDRLKDMGTGAGIYARARFMTRNIKQNTKLSEKDREYCSEVLKILEEYKEIAYNDVRCLYLIFKLKWLVLTGHPVLYAEKQTVKITQEQWGQVLDLINLIIQLTPERSNAVLKYVKAIALFYLGRKREYLVAFKELSHIYYPFYRRIIMSYIASKENGEVKNFTGSITSFSGDKKAIFYINELGIEIPYFSPNFVREVHALGGNYEQIEIGFNFLGIQVSKTNTSGGR